VTPERVAIAGLGLIGSSIGAALRRAGSYVSGYDPAAPACEAAESLGHVQSASTDLSAALRGAQLVVLAAPVAAILDLLQPATVAAPGATIMDVGSVKGPVVSHMAELEDAQRCVGGHPIAGKETSGAAHADAALFMGRPFVLTPHETTTPETLETAENLVALLGAKPIVTTAQEHDRVVARTSHLPQVLSSVLASNLLPGDAEYAGSGLLDMTRLALSDPSLWTGILKWNRMNITSELRRAAAQLELLAAQLQRESLPEVFDFMESAQDRARELRREVAA
jgi:prephenate dehydrogenase